MKAIRNLYRVPKKTWRKWSNLARNVFNEVYAASRDPVMWPDSAARLKLSARRVLGWNLAWVAADTVRLSK